jgi:hypothetical protein
MRRLAVVVLLYAVATVVMTWPIAAGIHRDLPVDLGDPAFVAGVLAWGSERWLALLGGDLHAAIDFWNAPIFYPEPLTLAYSEHFALHSLLTLPIYAVTRNAVLCYNVAWLATFVIGGLGMYLLVRDLVGHGSGFSAAAFVAGLAFVFAPYRVATMGHLHVQSAQWMPFVLLGLHRYFRDRTSEGLLITGAALWAQNMSSGYYMLYFGPFVALYAVVEIGTRGEWRRLATWRDLAVTAGVSLAATMPFALPYLERTRGTRRALIEVAEYSADVQAWVTASPALRLWGHLQTLAKPEGSLFPGVTVVVLAAIALWTGRRTVRSAVIFATLALAGSFWLSLGPRIEYASHPTDWPSLYRLLMQLPGFNAARVPARFATVSVLAFAILAGVALSRFERGRRRVVIAGVAALLLAEAAAMPVATNRTWTSAPGQIAPPPARLYRLEDAPEVFRYLSRVDRTSVIAHFPFGLVEREIQYGYYAMLHGRPIVNGYSGAFPKTYRMRLVALSNPFADRQLTETVLSLDRVTHVVVHGGAYLSDRGAAMIALLESLGWKRTAQFAEDVVLTR